MIVDYNITLIPQTTATNCWVAATSMLIERTIPSDGPWVGERGGLHIRDQNAMQQFARNYNLIYLPQQISLSISVIENLLRTAPFMLISGIAPRNGVIGTHALVVGGINGELIHAYDPEPANRGTDIWVNLWQFNSIYPFNAFATFQRR